MNGIEIASTYINNWKKYLHIQFDGIYPITDSGKDFAEALSAKLGIPVVKKATPETLVVDGTVNNDESIKPFRKMHCFIVVIKDIRKERNVFVNLCLTKVID